MFSAEKRYIDRLSGRPTASVPANDIEALFQLRQQSRQGLRDFTQTLPSEESDRPQGFKLFNSVVSATLRKIVVHVLIHEIRHRARIATILRLNGLTADFHDFLISPVMGGELRPRS